MQRITDSKTEDLISLGFAADFNNIRLVNFTKDLGEDYKYTVLDAKTYLKIMLEAKYTENDRVVKMVGDIFQINPDASIYFYGEDIATSSNTITGVLSSLIATNHITIAWDLLDEVTADKIKEHYEVVKAVATAQPVYKLEGVVDPTALKALREEISGVSSLYSTGDVEQNEDAKYVAHLSKFFPHKADGFNLDLPGLLENDFTQAEENEILGEQRGLIDANGNGGINTVFRVDETGRLVLGWGKTTKGKYTTVEHFKRWLDYNGPNIISNYLTDSNTAGIRIPSDVDGANKIVSVFNSKVLGPAVKNNVLYHQNGDPLNLNVKDMSTGEIIRTKVEATYDGTKATIKYLLAIRIGTEAVSIENTIFAGGGIQNV